MMWRRGKTLGKEGCAMVYLVAVVSPTRSCLHILRCFGDDVTIEHGEQWYILLEYAASLADRIQSYGGGLLETKVRRYTNSILLGLSYIHNKGYVYCDIKPHNILVVEEKDDLSMDLNGKRRKRVQESSAKITDLGLVKKAGERLTEKGIKLGIRGTVYGTGVHSL
ncbi:Mitogen-activated protein kinase kinase kinase 18 [Camellia lanceoleosa]|uniref:Mitogen-activated protein kinase kinase kinase 18 n=1 Tax=Camellia lanceoleosa TaxID=1840588 RepID=A0ACC0H463_9ERIC|nr:Mitogen-activated protein kinase kinase kinase 18 [Camellia lanceoleosa]